ncbi:MAG: hypothetical protein KME29_15850 [Calothrix sp. FI2-JRJ7]|nr:hypothetical protein [Calothrix sp. FI2-JRJ7]
MKASIYLLLEPEDIYDGQATTIPYNATGKNPYIKEDGTALPVDKREPFYGAMKECRITLTKGGGQTWALGSKEIRSVLAHEVFHCFTIDLIGIDANIKLPHWLREGSAMWVGEELAGGSSLPDAQRAWNRYLTGTGVKKDGSPISANLFQRDYDAIGLFAHLKNSKLNPWNLIKSALLAGSSGSSTDAFKALTSSAKKDILETWASGLARLPSLGSA